MAPEIEANRAFSVLKQLTTALSVVTDKAVYVSGSWSGGKHTYEKLISEWPVTSLWFNRWRESNLLLKGLALVFGKRTFLLKLEDPTFLVDLYRIFPGDRSIAVWSVNQADAADFQAALLAHSRKPGECNTTLYGDLMAFAPNLFWFDLLEDISYDDLFLWLHCGEHVPRALKQIIADNRLEPYLKYGDKA